MLKTIKGRKIIYALSLALLVLIAAGILLFQGANEIACASAATTPKYTVTFNYEHYYTNNTNTKLDGSGSNVTVTPALLSGANKKTQTVRFYLYGSSSSGSGTLANGGYINSSTVNIQAETGFSSFGLNLTNGSGAMVASNSGKSLYASSLADGSYTLTAKGSDPGWVTGGRTFQSYSTTCSFSFVVDTKAPAGIMYGGSSVVGSGGKTNASYVKFTASDAQSGIKNMYVKKPGSNNYVNYASGTQLTEEGQFSFYCVDGAGNTSPTYTVFRDSTAPVLKCPTVDFYGTSGKGFTVTASDTASGVKLYYMSPTMSGYALSSGTSYTVSDSYADGKYYFYAVDDLLNRSSAVYIELSVKAPEAEIVRSSSDNGVYATWTDSTYKATLNGIPYNKGAWIRQEGNYTLIVTNTAGRATTYTFDVGHYYAQVSTVRPTCTSQGYNVYNCKSCANSYRADYTPPSGHKYEESTIDPTCTERGSVRHTCSECGDYYDTDGEPANGHQYVEESVAATCTTSGCILHRCTLCGYEYMTNIVSAFGHSYESEIVAAASCTSAGQRNHMCERCGYGYTTEIPATGHNYEITDAEATDGHTVRMYTCTVCGDSYTQDLGNQYEKVTSYVEYLFNLYSPYMIWVFIGTAGVWSIVLGVMIILAHKNEDKEKAKRMIVNYVIGLVVIFAILVACPYLVKGIAALVG